jgi:hypothetical protein
MPHVLALTKLVVRLSAVGLTLLGVLLVLTRNLDLVPVYATLAALLTLSLVWLAGLGLKRGASVGQAALTIALGPLAVLVSLTGEWPLGVVAGVAALAETEWLAARLERRDLARRTAR